MAIQQICNRCVMDSSVPGVTFDEEGICSHCRMHDNLDKQYAINDETKKNLEKLVAKIKSKGKNGKYDVLVGVSGGIDSTYCLYMAKKLGLRPLAFNYDNGWTTAVAKQNIKNAVDKLQVDLRVVKPDLEELKRYQRASLEACIPETCLFCVVGIASASFQVAAEENIKYIMLGTSFRTEGITPLRWHYVDGTYFRDIIKKHGKLDKAAKKFNKLTLPNLFYYMFIKGIRMFQLPLYVEYKDSLIMPFIEKELGWKFGGREHFDCSYKPVGAYFEEKSGRALKKVSLSAQVRSNEMTREDALEKIKAGSTETVSQDELEYVMKRLDLTQDDVKRFTESPPRTFLDYKTNYSWLSMLKWPIKICCKLKLIPETAYEKYFNV